MDLCDLSANCATTTAQVISIILSCNLASGDKFPAINSLLHFMSYLQMGFPRLLTMQMAPGPQGDGLQGSGFSTHLWFWQTYPVLQSGSRTHSGPQPVMVSGFGMRPGSHLEQWQEWKWTTAIFERFSWLKRSLSVKYLNSSYNKVYLQIGFPMLFTMQVAPGPQGDGLQGSGFSMHLWFWQTYPVLQSGSRTHSGPQPVMVSGLGTKPGSHLMKFKSRVDLN